MDEGLGSLADDLEVRSDLQAHIEEPNSDQGTVDQNTGMNSVVEMIKDRFNESKDTRRTDEDRWLQAYQNFRGIYGKDNQFTDTEKSRAFIKITKTKVLAAYAQVTEVLFAGNKFPIGVIPSSVPKHLLEKVTVKAKKDDAKEEKPKGSRIMSDEVLKRAGVFQNLLTDVKDNLVEGSSSNPEDVVYEPAKQAGRAMEKTIQDQLQESGASKEIRDFTHELCLFGHGVFKGPLGMNKEYPKWNEKGKYEPIFDYIPKVSAVSIWDFYPDADAKNISECEYVIQRHKLSRTQLRQLKQEKFFRKRSIDDAIRNGPNYIRLHWEHDLEDNNVETPNHRYEALEYWGYIDREQAEDIDLIIPKEFEDMDTFQINCWIVGDIVIRAVLNPFKPTRIPYHSCPYELNPYSFFGIGVAENMEDTQLIMNGFMRMMIDNAALSSNLVFEVDEANLVPGQDLKVYPGKVFRRQAGAPGQAVFATKFQNVTQECIMVFDKARQLADEATGMPSYSHGQTGVSGVGRTASGMSMLMGAAAQNIKSVVRNIDDYLLVPLGKALFAFNMQFNFDESYLGDVEIIAKGTESLMRNEIRSQKLLQFMQMTANPLDAPFTKRDHIIRELAISLDIDPDMAVNDTREAKLNAITQADMAGPMMQAGVQGQAAQSTALSQAKAGMGAQGGATGGADPGQVAEPGTQGNSSPQGQAL